MSERCDIGTDDWYCPMPLGHPGEHSPALSDEALAWCMERGSLIEALGELHEVFRVPLTNNTPWLEDGDPDKPVFGLWEFTRAIQKLVEHFGAGQRTLSAQSPENGPGRGLGATQGSGVGSGATDEPQGREKAI